MSLEFVPNFASMASMDYFRIGPHGVGDDRGEAVVGEVFQVLDV